MSLLHDPERQRRELSCRSLLLSSKADESCRAGRDAGIHLQHSGYFRIIDVHLFATRSLLPWSGSEELLLREARQRGFCCHVTCLGHGSMFFRCRGPQMHEMHDPSQAS